MWLSGRGGVGRLGGRLGDGWGSGLGTMLHGVSLYGCWIAVAVVLLNILKAIDFERNYYVPLMDS